MIGRERGRWGRREMEKDKERVKVRLIEMRWKRVRVDDRKREREVG